MVIDNGMKPDAIFPGSFDPYTIAHNDLVIEASKFFHVTILICVNPYKNYGMFTPEERKQIILSAFKYYTPDSVSVEIWPGLVTDYCKEHNIRYIVRGLQYKNATEELDLTHIYYDDAGLKTVFFPTYNIAHEHISSTRVREYINNHNSFWKKFVPSHAIDAIQFYIDDKYTKGSLN